MEKESRNGLSAVLFLLLPLLCPSPTNAQSDEVSRSRNQPVKPFRIIGNIYYVGASDITSYLIATPQGHILLDSGFVETVPIIKKNVEQIGFRMEDIKILLNSHAHIDHAGGLAMLKEITGAKLFASEADAQSLAIGDRENPHWGDRLTFAAVKTDRLLRDGDTVEIGGVSLVARLTPGHTKGNTTWTMKVKDETSTYHVVFAGSMSAPGFTLVDNAKYPSILADYEKSFRLLQSLPCDIFLSSHGQFFDLKRKSALLEKGVKPNPFIDQKGFLNYVRYNEKAFRDELQKQRQAKVKSQG